MAKKRIVIAGIKSWNIRNAKIFARRLSKSVDTVLISKKENLSLHALKKLHPDYIFLVHWSWLIPEYIYNRFNCVLFHMTDLPFGRGGSPLQNLIIRKYSKTKISAIKVTKGIDEGPIYMKRNLSLKGSAEEIFQRASKIIFNHMIPEIIKKNPRPFPQSGKAVLFRRRKPWESLIPDTISLGGLYDHIRMLDAEGYPNAFMNLRGLRMEFSEAKIINGSIEAKVKIIKRKDK